MSDFERRRAVILEADLDRCGNNYAAAPCLAGVDIHSGTSQAGATDDTIILAAAASATDDAYKGNAITLADGRRALIVDYDGTTKVATVDRDWPINDILWSEDIDQWSQTNVTVDADVIASPAGPVRGDKILETATPAVQHQVTRPMGSYAINDLAIVRWRTRRAERTELVIDFSDAAFGASAIATFDLIARSAIIGVGSGAPAGADARIFDLWDDWQLVEFRAVATAAAASTCFLRLLKDGQATYDGTLGEGLYGWGLQISKRPTAYIRTQGAAVGLPDGVAYRILAAGGECYNAFGTCQDKMNFVRERKVWIFKTPGAPTPPYYGARPYIREISRAATEIRLEDGVAQRASMTVDLIDEPDSDIEADPYADTRPAAAGGSFFSRLYVRNRNYATRAARLRTAYMPAGWDASLFATEHYIGEKLEGPDSQGIVKWTFKDPIKLSDRAKIPALSRGKLERDIAASDTLIELRFGDGIDYPLSGYVRIGDEILQYTEQRVENGWNFNNSQESWTTNQSTTTVNPHSITLTSTGTDPQFISPAIAIKGLSNRYVVARLRRLAGADWDGTLYYSTSGHGFSASFRKNISADPTAAAAGDWVIVTWDMHALTAGGNDWIDSQITGLRFDLGAAATDEFEIDWISYGTPAPVSADFLFLPDTSYRGQFRTTAGQASAGDLVQLCKVYVDTPSWQVLEDLLLESGFATAQIDSATLQAEDEAWLGAGFNITTCLPSPVTATKLIAELLRDTGSYLWWDPVLQKAISRVLAPLHPEESISATLTDETAIIEDTVKITVLEDLRRTQQQIYYDAFTPIEITDEPHDYLRAQLYLDPDAESANEYGEARPEARFSRFFSLPNDSGMATQVARNIGYYRDAPRNLELRVDHKDSDDVLVGRLVDISTAGLVLADGQADLARCLILRRRETRDGVTLRLRVLNFGARYAFIAPDGTGDYPTDPQWLHIAPDSEVFDDGTTAYQAF